MIDLLLFLQSFSTPALDRVFLFISALTSETVFFIVLGWLYWCRDKNSAYGAGLIMISSFTVNTAFKNIFKIPRPFAYSAVRQIDTHTGYGFSFPSGHSQLSATFSGICSVMLRKKWVYVCGAVFTLLTGFSRMYLGVHTLYDVTAGFAIGAILTGAGYFLLKNLKYKYIVSVILIVLNIILVTVTGDTDLYKMSGFTVGFAAGHIIDELFISFDESGSTVEKIIRFLIGFAMTMLVKSVLDFFETNKFIVYTTTGFTITGLIPFLCKCKKSIYKQRKN